MCGLVQVTSFKKWIVESFSGRFSCKETKNQTFLNLIEMTCLHWDCIGKMWHTNKDSIFLLNAVQPHLVPDFTHQALVTV